MATIPPDKIYGQERTKFDLILCLRKVRGSLLLVWGTLFNSMPLENSKLPLELWDYHPTETWLWLCFLPLRSAPPTYTFACVRPWDDFQEFHACSDLFLRTEIRETFSQGLSKLRLGWLHVEEKRLVWASWQPCCGDLGSPSVKWEWGSLQPCQAFMAQEMGPRLWADQRTGVRRPRAGVLASSFPAGWSSASWDMSGAPVFWCVHCKTLIASLQW